MSGKIKRDGLIERDLCASAQLQDSHCEGRGIWTRGLETRMRLHSSTRGHGKKNANYGPQSTIRNPHSSIQNSLVVSAGISASLRPGSNPVTKRRDVARNAPPATADVKFYNLHSFVGAVPPKRGGISVSLRPGSNPVTKRRDVARNASPATADVKFYNLTSTVYIPSWALSRQNAAGSPLRSDWDRIPSQNDGTSQETLRQRPPTSNSTIYIPLWALLGSNQRPYACEAYALNQLS